MSPSEFSVRHPVSIAMLIAILVGLGSISVFGLPIEMFPELEFPMISVHTQYEGVAPQEIEERVTKPIERAVASVEQVKRLRSFTQEGSSFVLIEFNWGADTEILRIDVREKLDAIRRLLPDDIDDPIVSRMVFGGDDQAIRIAVSSDNLPLSEVRRLAEDVLKARFESIDGVANVDVYGGREREIQVNVVPRQLLSFGLPLAEVTRVLAGANLNNPGGRIDRGRDEFLVRTVGKFRSLDEIRALPIRQQDSAPITVGDVAQVIDTHKEVRSLSRFDGRPTVELAVLKETQGNVVAISDAAKDRIVELEGEFPQLELGVAFDAAPYIRRSITDVRENAMWGGFFAVLVLWPFLSNRRWGVFGAIAGIGGFLLAAEPAGAWLSGLGFAGGLLSLAIPAVLGGVALRLLWRSSPATLVVSLAMPISIVSTFILIHFAGLTLNMVSLGGLALGVGMLVDNSVVVIENISRHMGLGRPPRDAAIEGTQEVALAIIVSTLTTLAVFLPIAWIQGIAREVFNDLSLTVSFSLVTSLLVAVTIVPMLASKFLPRPERSVLGDEAATLEAEIASLRRPQARLRGFLLRVLARRRSIGGVLGLALGVFALALVGLAFHPKGFFPESDNDAFAINLKMPMGTAFGVLDRIAGRAERLAAADPDVKSVFASVRAGDRILVGVTLHDERSRHTKDIQADLRRTLGDVPDAEISLANFGGGGGGRPLDVHVLGDDPERLALLATIVRQKLETVPGAVDIRTSMETGRPELQVQIDRLRVADRNLSVRAVAEMVETAMEGRVVGQFTDRGDEVDIRVQYMPSERQHLTALQDLVIRNDAGVPVVLRELARIDASRGPVQIRRVDQRRMVQVDANLEKGYSVATVARQMERRMRNVPFPVGYSWTFSGEEERRAEAFRGLALSLAIAIVLVYMIMAALFESLVQPFVIMVTLPLAIAGVYVGLALFGHDLTVPGFVGIIMLAGIVVNNAIVLLDYVNRLRRRGATRREALALAGAVRLRPILMTAGTTILGMTPLAMGIGRGSSVLQALAAAVVGGLLVSTLLTLVVVPCVYDLADRLAARLRAGVSRTGIHIEDPFAGDSRSPSP